MKTIKAAIFYSLFGFVGFSGLGYFYLNKFSLGFKFIIASMLIDIIAVIGIFGPLLLLLFNIAIPINFQLIGIFNPTDDLYMDFLFLYLNYAGYGSISLGIIQISHVVYLIRKNKLNNPISEK